MWKVVNALTGAVADALTVPDYVQSAALLSIEGGQSDRGTDDALQALLDLRVVDSAFYCVLAASPSHVFHPDPAKGGELRWLNLSLPNVFSAPQVTTTRKGHRVMLVTTLEARWLVLDCGGLAGSERCLARSHWAKDGFDLRNAPQRDTHSRTSSSSSSSRRRRSGQAETEDEDSEDENGSNSDEDEDDWRPVNEQADRGLASSSTTAAAAAAARQGRLMGVHSGVRDMAEECWEALEDEFVVPAEQALAKAERALEAADSRLRELREQPWMVYSLKMENYSRTLRSFTCDSLVTNICIVDNNPWCMIVLLIKLCVFVWLPPSLSISPYLFLPLFRETTTRSSLSFPCRWTWCLSRESAANGHLHAVTKQPRHGESAATAWVEPQLCWWPSGSPNATKREANPRAALAVIVAAVVAVAAAVVGAATIGVAARAVP